VGARTRAAHTPPSPFSNVTPYEQRAEIISALHTLSHLVSRLVAFQEHRNRFAGVDYAQIASDIEQSVSDCDGDWNSSREIETTNSPASEGGRDDC